VNGPPAGTLADSESGGRLNDTKTIADLVNANGPFTPALTLAAVLPGLVPASEIPVEDIPLANLLAHVPMDPAGLQDNTLAFDTTCSASTPAHVDVALPAGFHSSGPVNWQE